MMFRGLSAEHIARRLVLRGWPERQAELMAAFLCDPKAQPPRWNDLVEEEKHDA